MVFLLGVGCRSEPEVPSERYRALLESPAPATQPTSQPTSQPTVGPPRPPGHRRMVAELDRLSLETESRNPFLGAPRGSDGLYLWASQGLERAKELLRVGRARDALAALGRARDALWASEERDPGRVRRETHILAFHTAVAWMRLGEDANCATEKHAGEACILPITGGGVHHDKEGATHAAEWFLKVLEDPETTPHTRIAARWLLNIVHQTLGDWPEGVPERWRVPEAVFRGAPFRRFRDIAPRLGTNHFDLSGGTVVEDFDGDGDLDILQSTWDPRGALVYYRNEGGRFAERGAEVGLSGLLGGLNMVQGDYDNDGDADVLVLRGAWLGSEGRHPNSLLRNDGGEFTDVTFEVGLGEVHYPTQTAAWADYDLDGDLDLYVGNEASGDDGYPSQLFRNEGGRFVDVARAAGVENRRYAKAVVFGDYDGDRWPDLYVSNNSAPNRLYRNNRDGTFTDVAERLGATLPSVGFPAWFYDYDDDGDLDVLALPGYRYALQELPLWSVAASHLGLPHEGETPKLYRNDGEGAFAEVSATVGLTHHTLAMGSNFGDLDNDGRLDLYLGTGYPGYEGLMPNMAYRFDGARYQDVTMTSGLGHLQKGHGVAFADLDQDGDQDLVVQMGGAYPGDAFGNAVFENPGPAGTWLVVELRGVRSNRMGVGARIRADLGDRAAYRWVGSGGSFGASPLRQHIGLGGAERVDLEVTWPTGEVRRFPGIAANQRVRVTEGSPRLERLPYPRIPFK